MEFLGLILSAVVLGIIVLPIVAITIANSRARELRAEMAQLVGRIYDLELQVRRLASGRSEAAEPASAQPGQAAPAASSEAPWPPEQAPAPAPSFATAVPQPESHAPPAMARPPAAQQPVSIEPPAFRTLQEAATIDSESLESRIGSRWFNRIGILAVLIGVAWFLKLAFDNHWIGPLGRVFIGLVAGAALIAWSERFKRRGFAVFSYSLKAIGSGTLYLSLWAAYELYSLVPAGVAFAAMIAVTAFNGFMAWIQDAELLALYAIAGGLSTPLLVSTGGNHEVALFAYLLMLDVAVLILVALRPWSRLLFAAFAGTVLFICGWWSEFYTQAQAPRTAFFLGCFFLLFALAPRLVKAPLDAGGSFEGWDGLALVALPVFNAALGFLGFYSLLVPATADLYGPWIAVAFAAFYLLLNRISERGILRAGPAPLTSLHLCAAIVFLTIAIPLKTHGRWMTIGWLAEGAALLWLAGRVRSLLVRAFALICLALGLSAVLLNNPPASIRPILNERFATYCVAIAAFAFMAWLALHSQDEQTPDAPLHWPNLAAAGVLIVNVLILVAFSWEIHSYWWSLRWRGAYDLTHDYRMWAQFSYSAFFMLFGAALLAVGFHRRSAFLRWQGLILLAATIAKVFLSDVSELSRGFRILSFIGLGALLLCVSYVYQRDWLNLRGRKEVKP